jgi:GMP synthase (glutamine-hydrolysing)
MDQTPEQFIAEQTQAIKEAVGGDRALVALSGGVDSSAVAALAHKAIGEQLVSVFIDDGLMREGEAEQVVGVFAGLGIKVHVDNAQDVFFAALKGIEDPEDKRKAFRDTFYKTLGRLVRDSGAKWMLQGTIAADVIETQRGVKTQHNILEQIGIEPGDYGLRILEPLKTLFKPEVRQVAAALGLPESVHQRMPFPGPGLATRIVGEVTPERVATLRKATVIVEEEMAGFGAFQAFAVLLNDRATGIAGDRRAFGQIIVVRAVHSENAMTASVVEAPWPTLHRLQERICAEVDGVTKVLYDLTPKPPSTIEYI